MKFVVLSLNRSAIHIKNIDYVFFDAIDNKVNICKFEFNNHLFKLRYGRDVKNGEKGCTLSHYNIIYNFYHESKDDYLVILEDDAMLEDNFIGLIKEINKIDCTDPEIYLLGFSKTKKQNNLVHKVKWFLSNKKNISGVTFGNCNNNFCGTVGYIINRKAAEKISNEKEVFWLADDWLIIKNIGVNVFYPNLPLVYEDLNSLSSIGNKVCCYNSIINFPKMNSLLILKALMGKYSGVNRSED